MKIIKKLLLLLLFPIVALYSQTYIAGGTINSDSTWDISGSPYVVQGSITIGASGTLNISAGVVVKFLIRNEIKINGIIQCNGTISNRVVFTSIKDDSYGGDTNGDGWTTQPSRGDWAGIWIYNSSNKISNCLLRYGGSSSNTSYNALLYISNCSPEITNCTIEESYNYGVSIDGVTSDFTLDSDTVRECNNDGIYATGSGYAIGVTNNVMSNCGQSGIHVRGFNSSSVVSNNTLSDNLYGVTTEDLTGLTISDNTITLDSPGRYPFYQLNTAFPVYSGNTIVNGIKKVAVNGTIDITIINPSSSNFTWGQIQGENYVYVVTGNITINNSNSITTTLNISAGVVVKFLIRNEIKINGIIQCNGTISNRVVFTSIKDDSYGGDTNGDGWTTQPSRGDWAGIWIYNSSNKISNCLLRYGGSSSNTSYNALLYISNCSPEITNCTIEESYNYGVSIDGVTSDFTLDSDTVRECNNDGIYATGSGYAIGVTNNVMSNCGQSGIHVRGFNSSSVVSNNTLSDNLYGVTTEDLTGLTISDNTITLDSPGRYPFYQLNTAFPVYSGNTIVNGIKKVAVNGEINGGRVNGGDLKFSGTWGQIQGENYVYVVIGYITINNSNLITTTLNISAGVVVKFLIRNEIKINGIIQCNGTISNRVVFTSIKDDSYGGDTNGDGWTTQPSRGDWAGIWIYNSSNKISNCLLRYGGSSSNTSYNALLYISNCSPEITNCTIEESYNYGVSIDGMKSNKIIWDHLIISNCNSSGLYITNSTSSNLYLDRILLKNNQVGLHVDNCSPVITRSGLINNNIGIEISGNANPIISNNHILNNNDIGIKVIGNSNSDPLPTINNNNFIDNTNYNIRLETYKNPATSYINAENNWFNSTDSITIRSKLYYFPDNNGSAHMNWVPFRSQEVNVIDTIFCEADINLDGSVDGMDLSILGLGFGDSTSGFYYVSRADINSSGLIDGFDLAILGLNFGRQGGCLVGELGKRTNSTAIPQIKISSNISNKNIGDSVKILISLSGVNNPYSFVSKIILDTTMLKLNTIDDGGLLSGNFTEPVSLLNAGPDNNKIFGITRLSHNVLELNNDDYLIIINGIKKKSILDIDKLIQFKDSFLMTDNGAWFDSVSVIYDSITRIGETLINPAEYQLFQNYPNPFNPTTTITFNIPKQSDVRLVIYNILGQKVDESFMPDLGAGVHNYIFNGANLSSGIYIYTIKTKDYQSSKKLILMK